MALEHISITDVVQFLKLDADPANRSGAAEMRVRCPFCGGGSARYHLYVNESKNAYHCFKCDEKGGALDLYARVAMGVEMQKGPGGNGSEVYKNCIRDLMGSSMEVKKVQLLPTKRTQQAEIRPADDMILDKAYTELLSLPYFKLSQEHHDKLIKRGLSEEAIKRNGYRTSPRNLTAITGDDDYWELQKHYKQAGLDELKVKDPILQRYSAETIICGMVVCKKLRDKGVLIERVPGFYKLGDTWSFRLTTGMFIPTRLANGMIVSLQMRLDQGNLRYMTVSSKGLSCGPTTHISRPHFPIANADILDTRTKIYLTEGPLKADVAVELMREKGRTDAAFIALHGVNNRNDLPEILDYLSEAGHTKMFNAFDMDRLVNPSVQKACTDMANLCQTKGVCFQPVYWDAASAAKKSEELTQIALHNHIIIPKETDRFKYIGLLSKALYKTHLMYKVTEYWPASTKGIDDFLNRKAPVKEGA